MRRRLYLLAATAALALTGVLGMAGQANAGNFCSSVFLYPDQACIHGAGHTMATWYAWSEGTARACTVLRGGPYQSSSYRTYTVCSSPGALAFSGWDKVGAWGYPQVSDYSTFPSRFGGYFTTCESVDYC
jgi:hypothetical protein